MKNLVMPVKAVRRTNNSITGNDALDCQIKQEWEELGPEGQMKLMMVGFVAFCIGMMVLACFQ